MAINIDFLNQLKRFNLIINKRITSNYAGDRRAAHTQGQGLVFKDYANYTFGDDFRSIDWRVYGRTDELYIRRYEEERNLTVHVILDASGSMGFKSRGTTKFEYGGMIGIGLAFLALKNNERFVLSTFAEQLEFFRPKKGSAQLATIINYLNEKKPQGESRFAGSLASYKSLIHSKALVFVISDFLYDTQELEEALARYKDNKIVLIQVLDPLEIDLNMDGDFNLVDMESDATMQTFISPLLKEKYAEGMNKHVDKIKEIAARVKAEFYSVNSNQEVFDAMFSILMH